MCRQIKKIKKAKDIPIIFMTALTENRDKSLAFKSGGIDYITKPVQTDEVLTCIKTHLDLLILKQELSEKDFVLNRINFELKKKQVVLDMVLKSMKETKDSKSASKAFMQADMESTKNMQK